MDNHESHPWVLSVLRFISLIEEKKYKTEKFEIYIQLMSFLKETHPNWPPRATVRSFRESVVNKFYDIWSELNHNTNPDFKVSERKKELLEFESFIQILR